MSKLNKRKVPNIVRGGYAQPLGNDLYMLHGAKHEQGGIDIGSNPKTGIEAEGGEVVQMKPNELRVLSAQPMLGGNSPAQLAIAGVNPDKVFDAQEKFKDRHGLRDDGTKAENGGIWRLIFPSIAMAYDAYKYFTKDNNEDKPMDNDSKETKKTIKSKTGPLPYKYAIDNLYHFENPERKNISRGRAKPYDKRTIGAGVDFISGHPEIKNRVHKGINVKEVNDIAVNHLRHDDDVIMKNYADIYGQASADTVSHGPRFLAAQARYQQGNVKKSFKRIAKAINEGNADDLKEAVLEVTPKDHKYRRKSVKEFRVYKNGGMIEINGNVKNGLIMTPRSRKKAFLGIGDKNYDSEGRRKSNWYEYIIGRIHDDIPKDDEIIYDNLGKEIGKYGDYKNTQIVNNITYDNDGKLYISPVSGIGPSPSRANARAMQNAGRFAQQGKNFYNRTKQIINASTRSAKNSKPANYRHSVSGKVNKTLLDNRNKRLAQFENWQNTPSETLNTETYIGATASKSSLPTRQLPKEISKGKKYQQAAQKAIDKNDKEIAQLEQAIDEAKKSGVGNMAITRAKRRLKELTNNRKFASAALDKDVKLSNAEEITKNKRLAKEAKLKVKAKADKAKAKADKAKLDAENKAKNTAYRNLEKAIQGKSSQSTAEKVIKSPYTTLGLATTIGGLYGLDRFNDRKNRTNYVEKIEDNNSKIDTVKVEQPKKVEQPIKNNTINEEINYNPDNRAGMSEELKNNIKIENNNINTNNKINDKRTVELEYSNNKNSIGVNFRPTKKFEFGGRLKAKGGTKKQISGITAKPHSWSDIFSNSRELRDYIVNTDNNELNNLQDSYSGALKESGYIPGNTSTTFNDRTLKHQERFNKVLPQTNNVIDSYVTGRGNTGDNRYKYADGYFHRMTYDRNVGQNYTPEERVYLQQFLNNNKKGTTFTTLDDGTVRYMTGMTVPKLNGLDVKGPNKPDLSKLNIDLQKELPNIGKRAATKALYGEPKDNWRDEIGLGLGLAGGILDPILRGRKLRDMRGYTARLEDPVKLKTKFNINPQLDATKQAREQAFRDIDANTASSATALARKQNTRNQSLFATNQLWGQKENIETQLINQDKMNLQGVRNRNTTRLNQAGQFNAQVRNTKLSLQADNISNGIQNVVNAGLDYLGRKDDKERYKNTLAVIQASNPNVSPQQPAEAGFDWGGYRPSQRRMYGSTAKLGLRKHIKLT